MEIKIKKSDDNFYFNFEPSALREDHPPGHYENDYFNMMIKSIPKNEESKNISEFQTIVQAIGNEAKSKGLTDDILKNILARL